MTIKRPEKFGGDVSYLTYETLEADYVSGAMHRWTSRSLRRVHERDTGAGEEKMKVEIIELVI